MIVLKIKLDVHMMVCSPNKYIKDFSKLKNKNNNLIWILFIFLTALFKSSLLVLLLK